MTRSETPAEASRQAAAPDARAAGSPAGRKLGRAMAGVAVLATVAALLGIGVRASFGAHVAVDEPQYLLTALSMYEDFDLDITDELAERRWAPWGGEGLPVQTEVLDDGTQISPHDPLLPLLLAVPMGLGGWVAAKVTLALMAGALAALTLWTAVRRFGVPYRTATPGVAVACASAPFAVYGQQVYPELPAALATVAAVALLTAWPARPLSRSAADPGPLAARPAGTPGLWTFGLVVTALPWLSVKYAPVAAVIALLGLWRSRSTALFAGFVAMGVAYLAVHRLVWGGWTVYASGDHFQQSGEFGVMGFDPDYAGRAFRLLGLLVDRGYGLVAWQPAWLLLLPAAAFALRRPRQPVLLLPLAAAWLTATFVALTMHGFWWPGRQLVVALPPAVILVLVYLARAPRTVKALAGLLGAAGLVTYGRLVADGFAGRITWTSGFEDVGSPIHQVLRLALPDYRQGWALFWPYHVAWLALAAVLVLTVRKSHVAP
ncbi:hypothetical protein [Nonomuraea sp. bgisy101]|uniref:hypothetical protein n=1 Tax=Nonomuraea sp. bgisy101 TaxID=3413784 RepID=UPI003D7133DC